MLGVSLSFVEFKQFYQIVTTKVVQLLHQTVDMKKSDKNQIVE